MINLYFFLFQVRHTVSAWRKITKRRCKCWNVRFLRSSFIRINCLIIAKWRNRTQGLPII